MKHVTENQVAGFLDHTLSPDEQRLVEAHLDACEECRLALVTAFRALDALRSSKERRVRRSLRWWIPVAAAAGLALILLTPRSWLRPKTSVLPPVRAPSVDGERGMRIPVVAPADDSTIATPSVTFTWRSTSADVYRVSLLTDDGRSLWTAETADTSLPLPPAVALPRGRTYFWRVDGIANGLVATSGIHRLQTPP